MLILGNSCVKENKKEISSTTTDKENNSFRESFVKQAIRDSVPKNDPVNVNIKNKSLNKEINTFVDSLYNNGMVFPEENGISLLIMKNTKSDLAIKLLYTGPGCSKQLVGLTDYKNKDFFAYLLTKAGINQEFFELKYTGICDKLEDHSTLINKTHYIQYYEMLRNIPQKILYYQKQDGEYVLTDIFFNDSDIPK